MLFRSIPAVYTQRKQPAVPSGPVGTHGPCVLNLPFLFPQKKREAKRKLPADVRKLKNDCEARGKRTRRARFAAAVPQALLPRALRLIRSGSNIFFPCSSFSVIFLSAFSHRPDWAASFSHAVPRRGYLVIPHSDAGSRNTRLGHSALDAESRKYRQKHLQNTLPLRTLSGPRIACGVTPFVIPHSDVVSRNIRGGESLLLFLLCHELDPALSAG